MSPPRLVSETKEPVVSATPLRSNHPPMRNNGVHSAVSQQDDSRKPGLSSDTIHKQLLEALDAGDEDEALRLISYKNFKYNFKPEDQPATALHAAVKQGASKVVSKLAKKYSRAVDERDEYLRTPLHYVAGSPRAGEVTQTLLDNGANVNALDLQNLTPLHAVVWTPEWPSQLEEDGRIAIVNRLLDNCAEVNTRDVFGDSPLHDAVQRKNEEIIKLLLKHGADSESRNFNDQTPQDALQDLPDAGDKDLKNTLARLLLSINNWDPDEAHTIGAIRSEPPQCWDTDQDEAKICTRFFITVRFFSRALEYSQSWSKSIHELLHKDGKNVIKALEDEFCELVIQEHKRRKDDPSNPAVENLKTDDYGRPECWKWIHIPVNQMSWVTDLVWLLTSDANDEAANANQPEKRKKAYKFLERNLVLRKGAKPGTFARVPHVGDLLKNRTPDEEGKGQSWNGSQEDLESLTASESGSLYQRQSWKKPNQFKFFSDDQLSLVVPYIDFETVEYLRRFDKVNDEGEFKVKTPRIRVKCDLEEMSRPYEGLRGLHVSQTLDESHYDMLSEKDLRKRNEDQVVSRWFKDSGAKTSEKVMLPPRMTEGDSNQHGTRTPMLKSKKDHGDYGRDTQNASEQARLLMVRQLWLWKLDKDTVVTAFPDRYHPGVEDSLLDTIRQGGIDSYMDPHQLIADILYEAVSFLDEFQYAGLGIHVLDIFDSAIAKCSHEEAGLFDEFSKSLEPGTCMKRDIDVEIDLISKCKDISDELHLILLVFETQRRVAKKFANLFWSESSPGQPRATFIEDCGIENLIERTKLLEKHAQGTLTKLHHLVQIKQAQSSLEEAHTTGQLNKTIWVFTLVTVFFTPLSFMTSLFAIPFNYFPQNDEGEIRVEEKWLAGRLAIGEIVSVLTVICAIFAWKPGYKRWKPAYKRWKLVYEPCERMWKHVKSGWVKDGPTKYKSSQNQENNGSPDESCGVFRRKRRSHREGQAAGQEEV